MIITIDVLALVPWLLALGSMYALIGGYRWYRYAQRKKRNKRLLRERFYVGYK